VGYSPMRFEARLQAALPAGWFVKESITLLAPDGAGNVIVSTEPLDPSIDTARYAEVQGELLRNEFPGFTELRLIEVPVFGGKPGVLRDFEWTPPDGVRVRQLQMYCAEHGRGYTATATTPASNFARLEEVFRYLFSSISLREPG